MTNFQKLVWKGAYINRPSLRRPLIEMSCPLSDPTSHLLFTWCLYRQYFRSSNGPIQNPELKPNNLLKLIFKLLSFLIQSFRQKRSLFSLWWSHQYENCCDGVEINRMFLLKCLIFRNQRNHWCISSASSPPIDVSEMVYQWGTFILADDELSFW